MAQADHFGRKQIVGMHGTFKTYCWKKKGLIVLCCAVLGAQHLVAV